MFSFFNKLINFEKLIDAKVEAKLADNINLNQDNRQQTIINNGLSFSDTKDIFKSMYEDNFPRLINEAANEAKKRVLEFNDKFFLEAETKLSQEEYERFSEPDIQYVCSEAVNQVARKNDSQQNEILIDLILSRLNQLDNEVANIVTNEAIFTLSKVTNKQLNILALVFLLKYTVSSEVKDIKSFNNYLNVLIKPFMQITPSITDFDHIEYAGCATVLNFFSVDLTDILKQSYPNIEYKLVMTETDIGKELVNLWKNSLLKNTTLTSVGKTLAISIIKAKTGIVLNEGIWIN